MSIIKRTQLKLFIIGVNYRSCGLGDRDRLFIDDSDVPKFLKILRLKGISNACVLSTCDRVEILLMHEDPLQIIEYLEEALVEHSNLNIERVRSYIYKKTSTAAIEHLFAVASSLDSQFIGETQILGQIKAAHRMARDDNMVGGALEKLLQAAYGVAKRVRSETEIGEWPVSISAAAVEVARGLHGDLTRVSAILMGNGNVGVNVIRRFQNEKIKSVGVYHPLMRRAEQIARELDCYLVDTERLPIYMKDADVIICAMGGRNHILTGDMVRVALKSRKNKPQFIVDTSVPGDVEPSVSRINDSFVYDLSDLERLTREGINNREKAANEAWQIINQEVELYLNDQAERKVVPTLAMLRQHFDQVRSDVLLENKNNAERATQLLVNRLLDSPTRVLRANASKKNSRSLELEKSTKSLFGLEVPNSYREESIKVTK